MEPRIYIKVQEDHSPHGFLGMVALWSELPGKAWMEPMGQRLLIEQYRGLFLILGHAFSPPEKIAVPMPQGWFGKLLRLRPRTEMRPNPKFCADYFHLPDMRRTDCCGALHPLEGKVAHVV